MSGLTLVVMAAGVGRRYGGFKQIEPIGPNGEWIVDYSVFDAVRAGFERVLFVVRDEIQSGFRERFDRVLPDALEVRYVVQSLSDLPAGFSPPAERTKPWGTGHAVWSCRRVIDGPFAVINADDYYGRGAFESLARFLAGSDGDPIGHALVGYRLSKTLTRHGPVTRGVCRVGADGFLLEIVERHRVEDRAGIVGYSDDGETWTTLPPSATVSMNMWGFTKRFVAQLSDRLVEFLLKHTSAELETVEFFLPGVVGRLVAAGARVCVLPTDETWFGVTYREDVGKARQEIAKRIDRGQYPMRLWDR